jgi:tetratricopeptide (TPR) repeat protein
VCYFAGRIEEGVRYSDAAQTALRSGGGEVPDGLVAYLGGAYLSIGQPDRWVDLCRTQLARKDHPTTRASLVLALTVAGSLDDAMAAATGLIDAAEATHNPHTLSYALNAYGYAWRDADPVGALEALRRGLRIAQDSGIRANESILAMTLGSLEANQGDPIAALDCATLAIRNYHDSGNIAVIRVPLANLAVVLDRRGRYESAATIAGFAFSPMTALTIHELGTAIAHLRNTLGDQTYESLARRGETMTTAEIVTYAYDQIEQARAELNAIAK